MAKQETENTSDLYAVRLQKLEKLREDGINPFSENCKQSHTSKTAVEEYVEDGENTQLVSVAGRVVVFRVMGKASFVKILDRDGKIQLYVTRDEVGVEHYQRFKKFDLGDFIGVTGTLFKTKTGEITVRAHSVKLVSKALRPLPEKWHGLVDSDQIYRQR